MYDHDPDDVEALGWERFITRQWESVFAGYRSWRGLRTMGRRWGDLIEAGLGCSQDVADRLVRAEIIHGPDRGLEGAADGQSLVSAMVGVLTDLRADLAEMAEAGELAPEVSASLLDQHDRLVRFIRAVAFGCEDGAAALP